jgi:hypothetical protein
VHAVLGILLGQHLRQVAHHDPEIVHRLPGHSLLAAQRAGIVGEEERALRFLAQGRLHFLGDEKRPSAGDLQRCVRGLHRHVLEQLFVGRKIATFEVARVVDQLVRIAGSAADRGEWRLDRVRSQPRQAQSASPIMGRLFSSLSRGSSLLNIVTHWSQEPSIFVMSVFESIPRGPNAS